MFRSASSFAIRSSRLLKSSLLTQKQCSSAFRLSTTVGTLKTLSPSLHLTTLSAPYHATSRVAMVSGEEMVKDFSSPVGVDVAFAMQTLAESDCVCFDVDSTVINEEGIDVLADYLGKGAEVAALTKEAMEGGMKFQDALAARLELLKPSKGSIESCLRDTPLQLTAGVEELIKQLKASGKHVYLVSGGFRIMIEPVAKVLQIDPIKNVFANTILFDDKGEYLDFDANEPTSQDMGKPKALQMIQQANGYKKMVMVGDGATDAQAKPPAMAFIGFGGVAVREKVKATADWFVTDFSDLNKIIKTYCH